MTYLAASLVGPVVAFALALGLGQFRRGLPAIALLSLPMALLMPTFEGGYWTPERWNGGRIGIEDAVVSLGFGVGGWAIVAAVSERLFRVRWRLHTLPHWRRFAFVGPAAAAVYLAGLAAGVEAMTWNLVVEAAGATLLAVRQRRWWWLAPLGAAVFGAAYAVELWVALRIWPDLNAAWNPSNFWCARWLGVPVGELASAAVFGAWWPVCMTYILDAGFEPVVARRTTGAPDGLPPPCADRLPSSPTACMPGGPRM